MRNAAGLCLTAALLSRSYDSGTTQSLVLTAAAARASSTPQSSQGGPPDRGGPMIDWGDVDVGPTIGSFDGPRYVLGADFAVEEWTNAKLNSTIEHQEWMLTCHYPATGGERTTWCSLTRITVLGNVVFTDDHNTFEGTLRINDVDWPRGRLDLTIVEQGWTSTVMLRWKYSSRTMRLESFTGGYTVPDESGARTAVEFKIPKYTTDVDVRIRFNGWRPAEIKEWDELVGSLDSADRDTWERLKTQHENRPNFDAMISEKAKAAFSPASWEAINSGHRKMSPEEESRLRRIVIEATDQEMERWLAMTQLSTAAKAKVFEYVRERMGR